MATHATTDKAWAEMNTTDEIVAAVRAGEMVVILDDEERENEGDLVMAADFVTPEAINFMATHARGLICLTLTEERCRQLDLQLMVSDNRSPMGTNFTTTIEAASGVTTGISAHDRARTIHVAIDPKSRPSDLVRPGHMFPLRARKGGVLVRAGQTEASVDLARLAGMIPAGVICEIMNDDGTMARMPDLVPFAQRHNLKIGTIEDLIGYRLKHDVDIGVGMVNPLDWLNTLMLLRAHGFKGPFNLDFKPHRTTSNWGVFHVSFPTAVDRFITLWEIAGDAMEDPVLREATEALKAGSGVKAGNDGRAIHEANKELLTLHELIAHRLVQLLLGLHRGRTISV